MIEEVYRSLLTRVAERLRVTPTTTDHLMLSRWRVLSACQYIVGGADNDLASVSQAALDVFATDGAGPTSDLVLAKVAEVIRSKSRLGETVLPELSKKMRASVSARLRRISAESSVVIRASRALPRVRERVHATTRLLMLPGLQHRLGLVERVLEDESRSESQRNIAGAAILYVDDADDVIPDILSAIGMLDDDFALRVTLSDIDGRVLNRHLHWSERISSLWDDLPFLQGVNLKRSDVTETVTWLDRINSYLSYRHVLAGEKDPLVLLQPSIACSPLHTLVSLIGLLVFDALTSARDKARVLEVGRTYELDGCAVVFEGVDTERRRNWLRLRLRNNAFGYAPPDAVDRLVAIDEKRLSSQAQFLARTQNDESPLQRFLGWDSGIAPSSMSSRILLITSHSSALALLDDVESNGVRLREHGLVRFIDVDSAADTRGAVVLVVPSLADARRLLEQNTRIQAIMVDGYDRLHRGRHDLPFLTHRKLAPSIVVWSAEGYYPTESLPWLDDTQTVAVPSIELADILKLDVGNTSALSAALLNVANRTLPEFISASTPVHEVRLLGLLDDYTRRVRADTEMPEHWKYNLLATARSLRSLIAGTPAEWSFVKHYSDAWIDSLKEKRSSLRLPVSDVQQELAVMELDVASSISDVTQEVTSKAEVLANAVADAHHLARGDRWYFVCHRHEQVEATRLLAKQRHLTSIEPVLLRDLPACVPCLTGGWLGEPFARRVMAHTPRDLVVIASAEDQSRWEWTIRSYPQVDSVSALSALSADSFERRSFPVLRRQFFAHESSVPEHETEEVTPEQDSDVALGEEPIGCVFLSLVGEADLKILARASRVIVEEGDNVRERRAADLRPDDRILLGLGTGSWSPAEEFTASVVAAIRTSQPHLIEVAAEWRRALWQFKNEHHLSTAELRNRLGAVRVKREEQTIEFWLDLRRASPIAPKSLHRELTALWALVGENSRYQLSEVEVACQRLRNLRFAASSALLQAWKGDVVDLGIDRRWLDSLVRELRRTVRVYEVMSISLGAVPRDMLGWSINSALASHFESKAGEPFSGEEIEDDDSL